MRLNGYINDSTEPDLLDIICEMEFLMHHTHEPILYSRESKCSKQMKSHINVYSNKGMQK